jgi:hypothetical protein
MPSKRKIKAKDIVGDIRSGTKDSDLMEKYRLTARGLQSIFSKLVEAGVMESQELSGRSLDLSDTVALETVRVLQREEIDFPLPIYDASNPANAGIVSDITEKGVGTLGIEALVNEVKTFVIPADEFFMAGRLVFIANCRWVERTEAQGTWKAGFKVIQVSSGDLKGLRKLMEALTLRERRGLT